MVVGRVEGPTVDTSQHTLAGNVATTSRSTVKSSNFGPKIPEVVSIDGDDEAVSGSNGTLRVNTEGGVGVWGQDLLASSALRNGILPYR